MNGRLLAALCSLLAGGCAVRGAGHGNAEGRGYDTVDHQQCSGDRGAPGRLVVNVTDQAGAALPGIHVHLMTADRPGEPIPPPTSAVTDAAGLASLQVEGGHYYSLLVSFVGFAPEARLLPLEAGCEGRIRIALRVLAINGLQVQQAGKH